MNKEIIKLIRTDAKMWLGHRYTDAEDEINVHIQAFANNIIKGIRELDSKAPRTGFKRPTKKELKAFEDIFTHKKCGGKKVRSSRGLVCSKCDIE